MNNSFINLINSQLREYYRDPQIIFWSFVFPLILIWILGVTLSDTEVGERVVGVILPSDNGVDKENIETWANSIDGKKHTISSIINSSQVRNTHLITTKYKLRFYNNRVETMQALKQGEINIFVEIDSKTRDRVYYLDPQSDDAMLTYFLLEDQSNIVPLEQTQVPQNLSVLESPGLRYVDFLIPGLIAMAIMENCLIAIGWSLIEKRISKVVRLMSATPMEKYELLSSLMMTCLVFFAAEITVMLMFAHYYFDVQLQGGILPLSLLIFCGFVCFSGIAVLIASRARKAQTGNGVIEITILILIVFSGIFFSYKNFPEWLISIVENLPLTILADSIRMVFIEGATVTEILYPSLMLTIMGIVSFIIGLRIFRWY